MCFVIFGEKTSTQNSSLLNQKNKNIALFAGLLVVLVLCVVAANYNPYKKSSGTVEPKMFAVANAAETLTKVTFQGGQTNNVLEREGKTWKLNDSLRLDPSMLQVLTALLERVEVQRIISGALKEEVLKAAADTGINVQLYADNMLQNSFTVAGNLATIKTYFVKAGEAYLMQLPGYESYVGGMFEVKTLDWKDRTIFNGTWQDMVSLHIKLC